MQVKRDSKKSAKGGTSAIRISLSSPLGRFRVLYGAVRLAWPLFWIVAAVYRRTVLRRTSVVVVVGSYLKTTTTRATKAALGLPVERWGRRSAGSPLAIELLRFRPGQSVGVVEVGIERPGQMRWYAAMLRPDVTVVTSIGAEHLTSMKTLEVTQHEKAAMVRALRRRGLAVLNVDDPRVWAMRAESKAPVVAFGTNVEADVRATDVALDWPRGTRFRLHADGIERDASVALIGRHMTPAALAAFAVARHLGVPAADALDRLRKLPPSLGRLDPVALPNGAWVLRDDWKATWDTLDVALDALASTGARRKIVVLGDLSEIPLSRNSVIRSLGARVGGVADRLVLVAHRKAMRTLASGAKSAGLVPAEIFRIGRDLAATIDFLARELAPGDVILLKGSTKQRLGRIALALSGTPVRCRIKICPVPLDCELCPMLRTGWPEDVVPDAAEGEPMLAPADAP